MPASPTGQSRVCKKPLPVLPGSVNVSDMSLTVITPWARRLMEPSINFRVASLDRERQLRPWALGRSNWLFAGSLRSGQRAATVMSLIQSARINGHDPYAYLKDVLDRLPTQRASAINELLPHNWVSESKT